jgi:hypothetical protein
VQGPWGIGSSMLENIAIFTIVIVLISHKQSCYLGIVYNHTALNFSLCLLYRRLCVTSAFAITNMCLALVYSIVTCACGADLQKHFTTISGTSNEEPSRTRWSESSYAEKILY